MSVLSNTKFCSLQV